MGIEDWNICIMIVDSDGLTTGLHGASTVLAGQAMPLDVPREWPKHDLLHWVSQSRLGHGQKCGLRARPTGYGLHVHL